MKMLLEDIIDRYTILKLKRERTGSSTANQAANEESPLEKEFSLYSEAIDEFRQKGLDIKEEWIKRLYEINAKAWDMESDIRMGVGKILSQEELEKIGQSAAMLPKFNEQRIGIKSEIAKKYKISSEKIEVPLAEIIDRYTILKLKRERIDGLTPDQILYDKPFLEKNFELCSQAIDEFRQKGIDIKEKWITELYDINANSWDMESAIRHGKEKILGLEEVGRRAIKLRGNSAKRTAIKNEITDKSKSGFKEVKFFK